MANQAINLTVCKCDKGTSPSMLLAARNSSLKVSGQLCASISDTNFALPFGVCSLTNSVCAFVPAGPWSVAAQSFIIKGEPTLIQGAKLVCAKGGTIDIADVVQTILDVEKFLNDLEQINENGQLIIPPNTSVDQNMENSTPFDLSWYNPLKYTPPAYAAEGASDAHHFYQWYNRVKTGGEWDYKKVDSRYENFGNYNYGATGTALGFSETELLRAAGVVHMRSQWKDGKDPFDDADLSTGGNPFGDAPYGDDERDQFWIKQGIDYANERLDK